VICFDPVVNTAHLRDMGCKACGSRGPFDIELTCVARVNDTWIDHGIGTDTWGLAARCICTKCGKSGVVAEFTTMGLDEQIEAGNTVRTEGK